MATPDEVVNLGSNSDPPNVNAEELAQLVAQRLMKDFSLPTVGAQPSAILLDAAQREYALKNLHYNPLPHYMGETSEDSLQFMKEYYNTVSTIPLCN